MTFHAPGARPRGGRLGPFSGPGANHVLLEGGRLVSMPYPVARYPATHCVGGAGLGSWRGRYCTYSPRKVRYLEVLLFVVVAVTPSSRGGSRPQVLGPWPLHRNAPDAQSGSAEAPIQTRDHCVMAKMARVADDG